jgi:hypothetical protein
MRAHRMSPKMPASVTPMASTTAMQPAGICSTATRVERGEDQACGLERSSRAGMKRIVKARPATRPCFGPSGAGPRSQTLRKPFLKRMVLMVAVVMAHSACTTSGARERSWVSMECSGKSVGFRRWR